MQNKFHPFLIISIPITVLLISLSCISFSTTAQDSLPVHQTAVTDSIKPEPYFISFSTKKQLERGGKTPLDTSLSEYHYYFPGYYNNYKGFGNTGLPLQQLVLKYKPEVGFNPGYNFMRYAEWSHDNIKYYHVRKPFTKIIYVAGTQLEQFIRVDHAQQLTRTLNGGFELQRLSSQGFYFRQRAQQTNFQIYVRYEAKNKRYGSRAAFLLHRITIEENGGIKDSASFYFEKNTERLRKSIPVALDTASNSIKGNTYSFYHYINFGQKQSVFNPVDSVTEDIIAPKRRIYHTISYQVNSYSYTDTHPDSSFYTTYFPDTSKPFDKKTQLFDSLVFRTFNNTIGWSTVDPEGKNNRSWDAGIFMNQENIHVNSYPTLMATIVKDTVKPIFDSVFFNRIAGADFRKKLGSLVSAGINGSYVLSGYNAGDFSVKGDMTLIAGFSNHSLVLSGGYQKKHPDFVFTRYVNPRFEWHNEFLNSTVAQGNIDYTNRKWKLSAGGGTIAFTKHLFFNKYAQPEQSPRGVSVLQAYITKRFSLGHWHFNTSAYYQKPGGRDVIRLPLITTFNSLYYENELFKKAVLLRVGVDVFFHKKYYADNYMPITKQFHLQDTVTLIGNYPFVDFFITARIKAVRIFAKLTNINEGYSGYTYYMMPRYPMPDRSLKLGIDWRFFD